MSVEGSSQGQTDDISSKLFYAQLVTSPSFIRGIDLAAKELSDLSSEGSEVNIVL